MANGVMTVDIVDYTQPIMFEDGAPCEADFLGNRYVKVKFAKNSDMYVGLPDTGYIGTRYWYDKHGRFLGQGSSCEH